MSKPKIRIRYNGGMYWFNVQGYIYWGYLDLRTAMNFARYLDLYHQWKDLERSSRLYA